MNQIGVGLLIGGLVGLVIGLTVAPGTGLPRIDADEQDLLCLEDRTKLMEEVREALVKMEQAGCEPGPQAEAVTNLVAIDPVTPPVLAFDAGARRSALVDAGAAKPLPDARPTKPKARPDAGRSKPKPRPDTGVHARVAKPPKSLGRSWMVQLIATGDAAEAGKIERQARSLGYTTEIVLEEVPDGSRSLYKVRVGPFTDKAGGAEARRRIKSKLSIQGWLHRSR